MGFKDLWNRWTSGETLTDDEQATFDAEQARILADAAEREGQTPPPTLTPEQVADEIERRDTERRQREEATRQQTEAARIAAEAASKEKTPEQMLADAAALRKQARNTVDEDEADELRDQADALAVRAATKAADEKFAKYQTDLESRINPSLAYTNTIADRDTMAEARKDLTPLQNKAMDEYMGGKNPKGVPIDVEDLRNPIVMELIRTKAKEMAREANGGNDEVPVPGVERGGGSGGTLTQEASNTLRQFQKVADKLSSRQRPGAKKIEVTSEDLTGRKN